MAKAFADLRKYIETTKTVKHKGLQAHYILALERIVTPEKAKPTLHKNEPPGTPIGCDW